MPVGTADAPLLIQGDAKLCFMDKDVDLYSAAVVRCTNGCTMSISGAATLPPQTGKRGKQIDCRIFGSEGSISYCGRDEDRESGDLEVELWSEDCRKNQLPVEHAGIRAGNVMLYDSPWTRRKPQPYWHLINHSRMHSNCEMMRGGPRKHMVVWRTTRDVRAGEEFFYDYGGDTAEWDAIEQQLDTLTRADESSCGDRRRLRMKGSRRVQGVSPWTTATLFTALALTHAASMPPVRGGVWF